MQGNAKIDDGSDTAELMRIFKEPDAYNFEKFPRVSKRKKQFKEDEGRVRNAVQEFLHRIINLFS